MRAALLAGVALLFAAPAFAQPSQPGYGPGPCPFGASSCTVTATGGNTGRTLADTRADEIDVMAYGAKCDFAGDTSLATDDSAAFNAATAAARAMPTTNIVQPVRITSPRNRRCMIKSTINMTGFNRPGVAVDFGEIECAVTGGICIDALGSRFLEWSLVLTGSQTLTPAIGIQIGRISNAAADDQVFNRVRMEMYFTFTGFYNFASESNNYNGLYIHNRYSGPCLGVGGSACISAGTDAGSTSYSVVLDGVNHWNAQSAFVTQTLPTDAPEPFGGAHFIGGELMSEAAGPTLWMGGATAPEFDNTYIENASGSNIITIYFATSAHLDRAHFDVGLEKFAANAVLITGPYATPTLDGLIFHMAGIEPTGSIFKLASTTTAATITGADIKWTSFFNNISATPVLFDNPALWTVSGDIYVPSLATWTAPGGGFTGTLCLPTGCIPYVPTPAINRNPEFLVDQVTGGASFSVAAGGVLFIDGWRSSVNGSSGATIAFAQGNSTPPPAASNYLSATTSVVGTAPTAAQQYSITSIVEGPDFASASFGTGGAVSVSLDFCAQSTSTTGTYDFFLLNNGASRSYVGSYVIPALSTWYCFHNVIPGDVTGTWSKLRNRPGISIGFSLGVGSNFQTTPGSWQAGNFRGTSSGISLSSTSGGKLLIGNVHLRITDRALPYLAKPYQTELQIAQHWFAKSFAIPTRAATNAGVIGALTMFSPYAFGAGLAAGQTVRLPQIMYYPNDSTPPTIAFFSTSATTANCYDLTQVADAGAAASSNVSDSGFFVSCPLIAGDAAGDKLQVQWSADSGG